MKYGVLKVVLAMAVYLCIDYIIRDAVFEWSLSAIKTFKRSHDLEWFFKYGHFFVSTVSYTLLLIGPLSVMDYSYVFIIVMAQGLGTTIFIFEKILIRAPRPFFVDPEIPIGFCKFAEFGSPSGHAFLAAVCYPVTAEMCLKYYKSTNQTRTLAYVLIVVPIIAYTGFSRIYDGMHSID